MVKLLPKHNTDHSPLTRHTSLYTVDVDDDAHSAKAVSSVVVYQTLLDGINSHIDAGESSALFWWANTSTPSRSRTIRRTSSAAKCGSKTAGSTKARTGQSD